MAVKATGRKVLIVDDEPTFINMVSKVLTHQGYTVSAASNGAEALRTMFTHKPDLVLLDVMMPEMDGWQTCRRIREVSDVPIIMLTGQQKSEAAIVLGLDCGENETGEYPDHWNRIVEDPKRMQGRFFRRRSGRNQGSIQ